MISRVSLRLRSPFRVDAIAGYFSRGSWKKSSPHVLVSSSSHSAVRQLPIRRRVFQPRNWRAVSFGPWLCPRSRHCKPALLAEFTVYATRAEDGEETATTGIADALTMTADGRPSVVVD